MKKPKKQTELKGIEAPSIQEIDDAAEEYTELRDKRMAILVDEVAAKKKLMDAMKKHKQTIYRFDDKIVEILPSEKIKVKSAKDADDEQDEE